MSDTDEPYNNGGWVSGPPCSSDSVPVLASPGYVVQLFADECIIVRRDGTYYCARDHDHGDTSMIDALNADIPEFLDWLNRQANRLAQPTVNRE